MTYQMKNCLLIKESVLTVKKIENVLKENVFTELSIGTEVYALNLGNDSCENLRFGTSVSRIFKLLDMRNVVFFKVAESVVKDHGNINC